MRTIKYESSGRIPAPLVEFYALLVNEDDKSVGVAQCSRYGYVLIWGDGFKGFETVYPPSLDTSIRMAKQALQATHCHMEAETRNEREVTPADIETYTEFRLSTSEMLKEKARYYTLLDQISEQPWIDKSMCINAEVMNKLGAVKEFGNVLLSSEEYVRFGDSGIEVPGKAEWIPKLDGGFLQVEFNEWMRLDDFKLRGETDIGCINRIILKLAVAHASSLKMLSEFQKEREDKLASYKNRLRQMYDHALRELASNHTVSPLTALHIWNILAQIERVDQIWAAHHGLDSAMTTFSLISLLACAFMPKETDGSNSENTMTFHMVPNARSILDECDFIDKGDVQYVKMLDGILTKTSFDVEIVDDEHGYPVLRIKDSDDPICSDYVCTIEGE